MGAHRWTRPTFLSKSTSLPYNIDFIISINLRNPVTGIIQKDEQTAPSHSHIPGTKSELGKLLSL